MRKAMKVLVVDDEPDVVKLITNADLENSLLNLTVHNSHVVLLSSRELLRLQPSIARIKERRRTTR